MAQHKWAREIHAWADGAEIEFKVNGEGEWMLLKGTPYWECKSDLFRIKPQPKESQCKKHKDAPHGFCRDASMSEDRYVCECEFWEEPKEPQYLYVYLDDRYEFSPIKIDNPLWQYIGKIKLEVEDD